MEFGSSGAADLMAADLSSDGMGVRDVPAIWEAGLRVRVGLQLPGVSQALQFEGTVAWRLRNAGGIAFQTTPATRAGCRAASHQTAERKPRAFPEPTCALSNQRWRWGLRACADSATAQR